MSLYGLVDHPHPVLLSSGSSGRVGGCGHSGGVTCTVLAVVLPTLSVTVIAVVNVRAKYVCDQVALPMFPPSGPKVYGADGNQLSVSVPVTFIIKYHELHRVSFVQDVARSGGVRSIRITLVRLVFSLDRISLSRKQIRLLLYSSVKIVNHPTGNVFRSVTLLQLLSVNPQSKLSKNTSL